MLNFKDIEKHQGELLIIPLGGVGEIGMNMTLLQYNGSWLIVDVGVGFSGPELPGTDLKVPDVSFISEFSDKIVGIVLTHAHEDHIGGLSYLWSHFECPVYAFGFTKEIIKRKSLAIFGKDNADENLKDLSIESINQIGPFAVDCIGVSHSVPDSCSLLISTPGGSVFHTGDWNFDENPVIGLPTDKDKLKRIGDAGVDVMLCDSTNIFDKEKAHSESTLFDSIKCIFDKSVNGRIFVTLFASNVARVKIISDLAKKFGRKTVVIGSSLSRMLDAACEVGFLERANFISIEEALELPKNELCAICTGCQAEPMAAMSRMVFQRDKDIVIDENDAVIFSSAMIPGNELAIYRLVNEICGLGAKVYYEKSHDVHVSGHSSEPEMKEMYELIRPKWSVPIHGEMMHLYGHKSRAIEWGSKVLQVRNGAIILVSKNDDDVILSCIGYLPVNYYGIDGRSLRSPDSDVMRSRLRMKDHGLMVVTVLIDSATGRLIKQPIIYAPGLIDIVYDRQWLSDICDAIDKSIRRIGSERKIGSIKKAVFNTVKGICKRAMGKNPEIKVQVECISTSKERF